MTVELIGALAEVVAALGGIVIGTFGVYTYYNDKKRTAQRDTLEAYTELQMNTFNKLNTWLPSEIKEAAEDKTSDGFKELGGYLADIERFCVGINEGIYDFDTFYKISHGYFDNDRGGLITKLVPIIEVKNNYADQDYFSNIHKVWNDMEKYNKS